MEDLKRSKESTETMLIRLQTVAMTIALNCSDHGNVARRCATAWHQGISTRQANIAASVEQDHSSHAALEQRRSPNSQHVYRPTGPTGPTTLTIPTRRTATPSVRSHHTEALYLAAFLTINRTPRHGIPANQYPTDCEKS